MNCERVYRYTFDEALIGIAQTDLNGRFVIVNDSVVQRDVLRNRHGS